MEQSHHGSGDNVGRDKITNISFSKKVVLIAIAGLLIAAVVVIWFNKNLHQEYILSGTVEEYAGTPANGSMVKLTVEGQETATVTTDLNGRFSYKLDEIPVDLAVEVQQKNKSVFNGNFDIKSEDDLQISVKLPMGALPFRVKYWVLDEFTFPKIFDDKVHQLGNPFRNSIMIQNQTLERAKSLFNKYSNDFMMGGPAIRSNFVEKDDLENDLELYGGFDRKSPSNYDDFRLLFNQKRLPELYIRDWEAGTVATEMTSNYKQNDWGVFRFATEDYFEMDECTNDACFTEFLWGVASRSDLLHDITQENSYFPEIDAKNMAFFGLFANNTPKYFGIKMLQNARFGCNASQEWEFGKVIIPDAALVVIQIENVNEEPLNLEKFLMKENKQKELRYYFEDSTSLDKLMATQETVLSRSLLKGESVMIPLYLYFDHSEFFGDADRSQEYSWAKKTADADFNYDSTVKAKIQEMLPSRERPFSGKMLNDHRELVNFEKVPPPKDSLRFVYGPSFKLDSLFANGANYAVRDLDLNKLYVEWGFGGGASCPFVFTYNEYLEDWVDEGVILYGFDAKDREAISVKELKNFNGTILIKEKDPETSYINSVYMELEGEKGITEVLHPLPAALQKDDKEYLTLDKGEEFYVNFEERKETFKVLKRRLVSKGYYVPYTKKADARKTVSE